MTLNKKVYADDDDDDDNDAAGKAVHMSRLCFAGETKMREAFALHCKSFSHFFNKKNCHIWDINIWNFNDTLTNNVVSFEQLGPELLYRRAKNVKLKHFANPDANTVEGSAIALPVPYLSVCKVFFPLWVFPLSRVTTSNYMYISPMKFCYNTSLTFLNISKDLDPSSKTGLDFLDCFGKK